MNSLFANIIIILILAVSLTAACLYMYKEKKKGRHCIGCPMAGSCPRKDICRSVSKER
jgi:hypothetical protein